MSGGKDCLDNLDFLIQTFGRYQAQEQGTRVGYWLDYSMNSGIEIWRICWMIVALMNEWKRCC